MRKIVSFTIVVILGWIVNAFFGIKLLDLAKPVYYFLHWYGLVIIVLLGVIVFWMLLLDGARRYHERIVAERKAAQESEINNWILRADRIHRLSMARGMIQQAEDIISFFRTPLPPSQLRYLDSNINSTLQQCLGTEFRNEYYRHIGEVPEPANEQHEWIRSHNQQLIALTERETPEPSVVRKVRNLKQ